MCVIFDRILEGVMLDVTVNTDTGEVNAVYEDKETWDYVEGIGAPGTADYWLNDALLLLRKDNEWEVWVD